jgi:hypothetical protein
MLIKFIEHQFSPISIFLNKSYLRKSPSSKPRLFLCKLCDSYDNLLHCLFDRVSFGEVKCQFRLAILVASRKQQIDEVLDLNQELLRLALKIIISESLLHPMVDVLNNRVSRIKECCLDFHHDLLSPFLTLWMRF